MYCKPTRFFCSNRFILEKNRCACYNADIRPNGMTYNSYVILDEKIAVFDTVDVGLNRMAEYLKKFNGRGVGCKKNVGKLYYL